MIASPGILRATSLLLLSVIGLLVQAGCLAPQVDETSDRPRVALIMKSLANEFFATMADGAKQHQQAHSDEYELVVNGIKDERDLSRQVALVDEMIVAGVDAIVIAPADSKSLVSVLKKAQQAGIVVVNIDNKLDDEVLAENDVTIPFVGPDNRSGARKVGDYLAGKLQAGDHVGVLEGIRTAFNGQQRKLGFEDAMKAAKIEIVDSQSAQWEMDQANKVASAMISEHPEIKALLCSNDSMALGALAAVKAAGRSGEIMIVGFDDITAVQQAIRDGAVLATADQHADQLAVYGIEYALQILRGEAAPEDKETPVDLVTAETLP
ncbi:MAG: sugar ABC transporter substrate-binding protein [Planctomycetes bacterium]|nr:sugar ABC transporter substrate-binding protein [Planctomycetota bacterium]